MWTENPTVLALCTQLAVLVYDFSVNINEPVDTINLPELTISGVTLVGN